MSPFQFICDLFNDAVGAKHHVNFIMQLHYLSSSGYLEKIMTAINDNDKNIGESSTA
jgi:hypothetical protein